MSRKLTRRKINDALREEMRKIGVIDPLHNFNSGRNALALHHGAHKNISSRKLYQIIFRGQQRQHHGNNVSIKEPVNRAKRTKSNASKISEKRLHKFYDSWEWKRCRYEFLIDRDRKCQCCSASAADGIRIVVDHIKPIRHYWHLRFDKTNLQMLCDDCNMGKGSWDETKFDAEQPSDLTMAVLDKMKDEERAESRDETEAREARTKKLLERFAVGDRVVHPEFGNGNVIAKSDHQSILVEFDEWGEKRIDPHVLYTMTDLTDAPLDYFDELRNQGEIKFSLPWESIT